jgi:LPXTG-motif cell wall-anchored protein
VLPEAGVDFPAKSLSIVGIIVTLLGFLILL